MNQESLISRDLVTSDLEKVTESVVALKIARAYSPYTKYEAEVLRELAEHLGYLNDTVKKLAEIAKGDV
jgi:hypothetical protein